MDTIVRQAAIEKQTEKWKKGAAFGLTGLCIIFAAVLVKAYLDGCFDTVDTFQKYMAGFGLAAPLFLAAFQAAQVVLPVLPGLLGCVAGALMFGASGGFWCNYIGISAGSILAFWLARKYGRDLVGRMFPGEKYSAGKAVVYFGLLYCGCGCGWMKRKACDICFGSDPGNAFTCLCSGEKRSGQALWSAGCIFP